jgi:hypothetical protein
LDPSRFSEEEHRPSPAFHCFAQDSILVRVGCDFHSLCSQHRDAFEKRHPPWATYACTILRQWCSIYHHASPTSCHPHTTCHDRQVCRIMLLRCCDHPAVGQFLSRFSILLSHAATHFPIQSHTARLSSNSTSVFQHCIRPSCSKAFCHRLILSVTPRCSTCSGPSHTFLHAAHLSFQSDSLHAMIQLVLLILGSPANCCWYAFTPYLSLWLCYVSTTRQQPAFAAISFSS